METSVKFPSRKLNIDITHRCPLQCIQCGRQRSFLDKGKKVPGEDLSIENFRKIVKYFDRISFCGQYSDPIHHPEFKEMLEILYDEKDYWDPDTKHTEVHVASSHKPKEFYIDCFKANPNAEWVFGIDGLPRHSDIYRINQDGQKLWDIMMESKKYLKNKPVWQFIIFKYNEKYIETAKKMAKKENIHLILLNSSRFKDDTKWLQPSVRV